MRIGIMQGRLVPPPEGRLQAFPRDRWAEEFARAAEAGLSSIEWIFDLYGEDVNPITTEAGIKRMLELSAGHGVEVLSVCADYFMDKPLVRASLLEIEDRLGMLRWLLERCQMLGVNRVVLPFVDVSRIDSEEEAAQVAGLLEALLPAAERTKVEIHLEASLAPAEFADFLARIPNPMIKVNYDSGNSASLGYDVREEFNAYGPRIGSVHVKDRVRGGGTVPLGDGDADLPAFFEGLKRIGYNRDLILQVARDKDGDEVAWARKNRAFVEEHL